MVVVVVGIGPAASHGPPHCDCGVTGGNGNIIVLVRYRHYRPDPGPSPDRGVPRRVRVRGVCSRRMLLRQLVLNPLVFFLTSADEIRL